VIASDGVFEFLTNQMVMDLILSQKNIFEGCKAVVASAYDLWLRYEVRTDDITIIIILINNDDVIKSPLRADSVDTINISPILLPVKESKPVRRGMSREKRKLVLAPVDAVSNSDRELFENDDLLPVYEKTAEERQSIEAYVRHNFLFCHLNREQESSIIDAMQRRQVKAGENVIRQGELGESFYIISKGIYEVYVLGPSSSDKSIGDLAHTYERSGAFGELSLMYVGVNDLVCVVSILMFAMCSDTAFPEQPQWSQKSRENCGCWKKSPLKRFCSAVLVSASRS
jgi:hypothetical protein